jgi:hypothetical protein
MLIINKKFSNLLKGYQRALELDQKLKTEWESKYKPKLLGKLQEKESEQINDYQEKLLAWQESERQGIAQWEETEKIKLNEWETNEIVRQTSFAAESAQNQVKNQLAIEQQKQKRTIWMILWISFVALCFVLFLIGLFVKVGVILGLLGSLSAMGAGIFSIVAFIIFIVKCFTGIQPLPRYVPAPKPQPAIRIANKQPQEPAFSDDLTNRFSCPSVIAQWMEVIQYKDQGKEYFRKLAEDNPKAIGGIPGEMAMLNEHIWCERIDLEGIYILGLKTSTQGDIDGISITKKGLWVLESKYLLGNVVYKNGIWKQSVYVKHPGQSYMDGWEEKEFTEPFQPDVQLEKAVKKITHLFSDYSKENPWMKDAISGTIVFTNENVDLDISNCDFLYAKIYGYFSVIFKGQDIDEMTFERQLEIADILLAANRKYEKPCNWQWTFTIRVSSHWKN